MAIPDLRNKQVLATGAASCIDRAAVLALADAAHETGGAPDALIDNAVVGCMGPFDEIVIQGETR